MSGVREFVLGILSRYGHQLYAVEDWHGYDAETNLHPVDDLDQADVITSATTDGNGGHTIMLDLDVPAVLVPSSTPGHSHLYIDVEVAWPVYERLLEALKDAGVLQPGYTAVSKQRGFTALRLPWVQKVPDYIIEEDQEAAF